MFLDFWGFIGYITFVMENRRANNLNVDSVAKRFNFFGIGELRLVLPLLLLSDGLALWG